MHFDIFCSKEFTFERRKKEALSNKQVYRQAIYRPTGGVSRIQPVSQPAAICSFVVSLLFLSVHYFTCHQCICCSHQLSHLAPPSPAHLLPWSAWGRTDRLRADDIHENSLRSMCHEAIPLVGSMSDWLIMCIICSL